MIKKNMDINYYKIYEQNKKKKLYCYPLQLYLHISPNWTEWETRVSRAAENNFMTEFWVL